ncbi:MAG: hypothetical protein ACOC22_02680 [bacterium]
MQLTPEQVKKAKQLQEKGKIGRYKLMQELDIPESDARALAYALDNPEILSEDTDLAIKFRKTMLELQQTKKANKKLLDKYNEKEQQNDLLLGIQSDITQYERPEPITKDSKGNAVAIAIHSDVHAEENVEKDVVLGLNEYNPDICKEREERFFKLLLKIINHHRKNYTIDTLVLGLLGDMISGYIHEDLRESNFLSPTEAVMFIKEQLVKGIKFLADKGDFKKIIIPCAKGNHGRTTQKKRFSTAYKNSYEWMMYHDIKNMFNSFGGYEHIEFIIPKSEFTYIESFDKTIMFSHGDHFRFAGGVGGFQVPLRRWALNQQMVRHFDMAFMGHWHHILNPTENVWVNASVVGHTPYAAGLSIQPSPPSQLLVLQHEREGFIGHNKIML